ncbi:hypothetical protein A3715_28045 [Oleiphilus sp. HI0009]|nr:MULTISPECIES: hypothetical protein [unclassified Oleiphilus]KZX76052.1 hypothetical protein A3715_13850 [Oleiphilus sp. HI0009]KZX85584.1 hypothetical protein A3715_28045 [Oleiphilus sp. HI0009]KZY66793.1 hypothetical protein A3738_16350 [Oleiphilus sp. HI0066]
MIKKLERIFYALIPLIAIIYIWATWQSKINPIMDKVYETGPELVKFHEEINSKLAAGELTKEQVISIYQQNTTNVQKADEDIITNIKSIIFKLFSILSLFALIGSARAIYLEIKRN